MLGNTSLQYNSKNIYKLALFASCLAFVVIVLGAYTRLTDAGLGCPDWPGCYGHWVVPKFENHSIPGLIPFKAWTEMIHRYIAGSLGITILILFIASIRKRRFEEQPILLPFFLVLLVIFQGLLGMWTVTLKLYPIVVMTHLLGGFTTLSLLWWLTLKLNPKPTPLITLEVLSLKRLRFWGCFSLIMLTLQIFLGGWTSANYAALVCLDFPLCQTQSYLFDFKNAFNLTTAGVTGSLGEPLSGPAKMTIHMIHRLGALLSTLVIGWFIFLSFSQTNAAKLRTVAILTAFILLLQLLLGINNVLMLLPLPIAVAHNATGALLLLAVITLNYYFYSHIQIKNHDTK